jgi:hypothetical protein
MKIQFSKLLYRIEIIWFFVCSSSNDYTELHEFINFDWMDFFALNLMEYPLKMEFWWIFEFDVYKFDVFASRAKQIYTILLVEVYTRKLF